ncbi:MAG: hypothetical protein M1457_01640, partial [bacterium]|nr:hypothetical protein [bacterium]
LMKIVEMGIPAGVAFGAFIVAAMARVWAVFLRWSPANSHYADYYRALGLWLGCLGFLGMNLFDYNYANFSLGPMFMGMLGILLSVALDLESAQTVPAPAAGRAPESGAHANAR